MTLKKPSTSDYNLGQLNLHEVVHAIVGRRTLCGTHIAHPLDLIAYTGPLQEPTCQRCLKILQKRREAAARVHPRLSRKREAQAVAADADMPDTLLTRRWERALDHLFVAMRRHAGVLGTTDATPALTLEFTLLPLLRRYMLGDRSTDLYQAMMSADQGSSRKREM